MTMIRRCKARRYYLQKITIKNYNVIINKKTFSIWCFLDYDYIKNHSKLIAADLSRQNKLDIHPKVIQLTEFVRQLKYPNNAIVAYESMFVLRF